MQFLGAGKIDISKTGGQMEEQEGTELWETALTAVQQPGSERIAWTQSGTYQAPEDLRYLCNLYSC